MSRAETEIDPRLLLTYASQTIINQDGVAAALEMISALRRRGAKCKLEESKVPVDKSVVSLAGFQKFLPVLGTAVLFWAFDNRLPEVSRFNVYESLASRFHFRFRVKSIEADKRAYQIDKSEVECFFLYDLMVPGKIQKKGPLFSVNYSPAGYDWQISFGLREGEVSEADIGHLVLAHLGLVVERDIPLQWQQRIDAVLQSQEEIWPIFEKLQGTAIRSFQRDD
ncbi:MAG: hypothetical protein JW991_02325 [Candidatus Pacebacteria bacterium]|nr:hypothetical protein [Candidatus Paceibacterota bacterium]